VNLSRKWEKYANIPKADVSGIGFSPNGNELFAFFQNNCSLIDCKNVIMLL
jgi:hypothetical protein